MLPCQGSEPEGSAAISAEFSKFYFLFELISQESLFEAFFGFTYKKIFKNNGAEGKGYKHEDNWL